MELHRVHPLHRQLPHRLAKRQVQHGGGVGGVLAQDQDRVRPLDLPEGNRFRRPPAEDLRRQGGERGLVLSDPLMESLRADQGPDRMVPLQGGPRRTDSDHPGRVPEKRSQAGEGVLLAGPRRRLVRTPGEERLPDPAFPVHELVTVAAPIAQEIAVHLAVVAGPDPAEPAVALAGNGVAPQAAVRADRGRGGEVPLPGVVPLQGLVGEDSGGADLDQVPAELTLEGPVLIAAEVHRIVGAEDVQVPPSGKVPVEAHAPVAGDATVHLVINEGTEVLVPVGALQETELAVIVAAHHRHVLKVALASLVADRAVVGVVHHQPLDHRGPEPAGFGVGDGDPRPVVGRGHAGHDQLAPGVVLVLELLHRALPARPHRAQGGVPAEVRKVVAPGERHLEEVLPRFRRVGAAVDPHPAHQLVLQGQRLSVMWRSKSAR